MKSNKSEYSNLNQSYAKLLLTVGLISTITGCFRAPNDAFKGNVSYIQRIVLDDDVGEGLPAPELIWLDERGNEISFSEYTRGKVVLVNIWATWCTFCKMTFSALRAVDLEYDSDDLAVIGISTYNSSNESTYLIDFIYRFVQERDMQFPTIIESEEGEIWKAFGLEPMGVPTTILINRDGIVVRAFSGGRNRDQFREEIDLLL